jgi:hypothetical protein
MTSRFSRNRLVAALAAVVALGLAACSDHTAPRPAALDAALADSISAVLVEDAQSELDVAQASGAVGFLPGAPPAIDPAGSPPSCISISPVPPVNSDSDRVQDSVRVAFDNCVIGYRRSADTLRGTIDIVDPNPTVTDHAIKLVFANLARIRVDRSGRVASITLNGTRMASRDSVQVSASETNFRTDFLFKSGDAATHTRTWSVTFTADVPGRILHDARLPSGSLSIEGTSTWTRGTNTFSLQVSTPTLLHHDAACDSRPTFDSGTVVAVVARNGATSTITIEFTACGEFTVTRS